MIESSSNPVLKYPMHWRPNTQAWGNLKPEFNVCAIGKRQSPINIEDGSTLQGPAEPIQFTYPNNARPVQPVNGRPVREAQ
jgi:carbonic anhydrase